MSEETENTTDHLDRLDTQLKRAELIERTKSLTAPQREEFFYRDPNYPADLLRDIAVANGDDKASIAMGIRQMDAATEAGENIMDAVAGTRENEDGETVEVTYADLQREANEEGNINESIRLGMEAYDAAQGREYEDALKSPQMAQMKELAEQRGQEFIEKHPHLDPNREEDEVPESSYENLPPHLRLNEDADSVGPLQAAQAKVHKAQQEGDVRGSVKAAVQWMDNLGDDAA